MNSWSKLERFAWCLVAIGFCWSEVDEYHLFSFLQQMYIMAGIGLFYCVKKSILCKKILLLEVPFLVAVIMAVKYCNRVRYFAEYSFFNTALPILIAITMLLYIFALLECFHERQTLKIGEGCVLMLLFAMSVFLSVNEKYYHYMAVVFSMLPYAIFLGKKDSQRSFFQGITDGLCIGVWVVQVYAWMHRPYNAYEMRYSGATTLCIYAARIYLMGFAAWLTKYVQWAKKTSFTTKRNRWKQRCLVGLSWMICTFILSIVYMTGNRGTVVAMLLMILVALVIRYIELNGQSVVTGKYKSFIVGGGKVIGNFVCFGCISLMLFPIAFTLTRWLPAYFNEPDYLDSSGNRYLSYVTQEVGEPFLENNEFRDDAVKKDDDIHSVKYITYYECLCFNIGRLIPGMNVFFYETLGDKLWETKANRIQYFYEQGYYSEEEYNWYWTELNEQFENQYVGGSSFSGVGDGKLELPFKEVIYQILSTFLLYLDAGEAEVSEESYQDRENPGGREKIYPGDTQEYPWSTRDALDNGLGERAAIYLYAIRHLNLEGHADGVFRFYQTEDVVQAHAHNIFLQTGYEFGVFAMVIFSLMFLAVIIMGTGNIFSGNLEYICPVVLFIGFAVFGMFDIGFDTKNGITAVIILSAMCIRRNRETDF